MTHPTNQQSNNLVSIIGGQPFTTTLTIAKGVDRPHHGVIQIVRQYQADLEEFGLLAFEMRPRLQGLHGGGDVEYAILNERQAMLVMTYMRNSNVVRRFKKSLIRAFFSLAERVQQLTVDPTPIWQNPSYQQCEQCELETKKFIWTLQGRLLHKDPLWNDIRKYHAKNLNNKEIGKLVGLSRAALRRQMKAMEECGLLCPRNPQEVAKMSGPDLWHKYAIPIAYGVTAQRAKQVRQIEQRGGE